MSDSELEQLAAALLRAMGYRTRVTPKGPDRRLDVFASRDGLGLEFPRIKVEVKHTSKPIGSEQVRSFVATLREGDRGIFLSTRGFTKDALYEGERAERPVYLMNIDTLAEYIITYYESFDREGRDLVPLVKIYWPVD